MVDLGVDRGTVGRYNPFTSTDFCITICAMSTLSPKVFFADSAFKHGFTKEQIVNVFENVTRYQDNMEPNEPHQPLVNLVIGPAGPGKTGKELEVMYSFVDEGVVIFHCMEARARNKYTAIEKI